MRPKLPGAQDGNSNGWSNLNGAREASAARKQGRAGKVEKKERKRKKRSPSHFASGLEFGEIQASYAGCLAPPTLMGPRKWRETAARQDAHRRQLERARDVGMEEALESERVNTPNESKRKFEDQEKRKRKREKKEKKSKEKKQNKNEKGSKQGTSRERALLYRPPVVSGRSFRWSWARS